MGIANGTGRPGEGSVGKVLVANAFHMAQGLVFLGVGAAIVLDAAIIHVSGGTIAAPGYLATALLLVVFGAAHVRVSARQWSHRFTGDAISMAGPPPHPSSTRDERKARARDYLRALIRTGIKAPPMPPGVIGEFVQLIAPRLNMAQPPVRAHAGRQIRRGLHLALVVVGLGLAWVIAAPAVFPLLAAFYFVAALLVLRPHDLFDLRTQPRARDHEVESPLPHPGRILALLVLSVLAPAGLTYAASEGIAEPFGWLASIEGFAAPTLAIVLPVLAGGVLFFVALSRQTRHLRESQGSHWGSTLPYALPEVSQALVRHIYDRLPATGTLLSWRFDRREEALYAGFLAEGEARLDTGEEAGSLGEALRDAWKAPDARSLLLLDGLGLLLGLVACVLAWQATTAGGIATAATAFGLLASSQACLSAADQLWKRADFVSLVYEVDIEATWLELPPGRIPLGFQRAAEGHAASGNVRARVLRMRSAQFEPRGQRYVTGLELDIRESTRLATAVEGFQARPAPPADPVTVEPDRLQA